jgi:hypothetical protein
VTILLWVFPRRRAGQGKETRTMKKTTNAKLHLNAQTLRQISGVELIKVVGGYYPSADGQACPKTEKIVNKPVSEGCV